MTNWKEENVLALFLLLSLLCHGMYFEREWLILGILLLAYRAAYLLKKNGAPAENLQKVSRIKRYRPSLKMLIEKLRLYRGKPELLLLLMVILALIGILNPVREFSGWLEALRWLFYLTIFRMTVEISEKGKAENLLNKVIGIGLAFTMIGWLPGSELIWIPPGLPESSRFSSLFCYPNAAGVFLGVILILLVRNRTNNIVLYLFLGLSLLCTASRGAIILLLFTGAPLVIKKVLSKTEPDRTQINLRLNELKFVLKKNKSKSKVLIIRGFSIIPVLLFCQEALNSYSSSFGRFFCWVDGSTVERLIYYRDGINLAIDQLFLPSAGGWLAFPFIQQVPYWTLDPHSSFMRVLINQGGLGAVFFLLWGVKGIKKYISSVFKGEPGGTLLLMTAATYLGLHSLIDVDMAFGSLGIVFWLLLGVIYGQLKETEKV